MKILLVDPSPSGSIPVPAIHFPLGIAYIAAVARHRGHDVSVAWGTGFQQAIDTYLKDHIPDIVGIQTFINTRLLTSGIARQFKHRNASTRIVLGGVNASNMPQDTMRDPNVDFVVSGEGERPFGMMLDAGVDQMDKVPGIFRRDASGQIVRNPGGSLIENLDDIPEIPYELFYSRHSSPVGHVLTHRGCPHHCSHCPLKFRAGVSIRFHSVSRTVSEIQRLNREFGIQNIEFFDENFTMDADHVTSICSELERMAIRWSCTARITEISETLACTMVRSGCNSILFGLGSGVPRLQDVLGTHEDLAYSKALISKLTRAGVRTVVAFSMGLPTETKKEFASTIQYALSLEASEIRFEPCAPIPGTLLYEAAQSDGRFLVHDWDNYRMPGQLVYLPKGRSETEFRFAMWRARALARFKRVRNRIARSQMSRIV